MSDPLSQLKHGDQQLGRFYPKGYIFSVFLNSKNRAQAVQLLRQHGWTEEDLIEFGGEELIHHREELLANRSILAEIFSKFANRDRVYHEALALAARSPESTFLLIYAPDEDKRQRASEVINPLATLAESFETFSFNQIPVGADNP
jgi:hypothetical protein